MIHSPHVLKDTPISAEMWVCAVQTCGNVIRRQWDCASTLTHFKHRLVICPQWVVDINSSRFLYDSAPEINIRHKCTGSLLLNARWLAFCAALVHLRTGETDWKSFSQTNRMKRCDVQTLPTGCLHPTQASISVYCCTPEIQGKRCFIKNHLLETNWFPY